MWKQRAWAVLSCVLCMGSCCRLRVTVRQWAKHIDNGALRLQHHDDEADSAARG